MRAGGFALDGDGAFVAGFGRLVEDLVEVDEAFADQDFFAELVGVGGPAAVFGVDGVDVGAEDVDRVDGIGLAVEDEVGGVEADAEVGHFTSRMARDMVVGVSWPVSMRKC